MGAHDDLLRRFKPQLRYDSIEQYFADSPAQWTDNPGNELRRADEPNARGALIAAATPQQGVPRLELSFLGAGGYADGTEVREGDLIGDPARDYRAQYVRLRVARPDLSNVVHGHGVEAAGVVWLQYWFWYFYNDYNLALGAGLHEGDWEMIQLRMHGEEPDLAVYAQHRYAEKRPWPEVEKAPGNPETPVVYVARGSHASYFEAGFHQTEAWYDLADGKRQAPEPRLEIVDGAHGWSAWPGIWGDTRPRRPGGVDQPSPPAPSLHPQWSEPDALLATAREPARRDAPSAPDVTVSRDRGLLAIQLDLSRHPPPAPGVLTVTVNSGDEPGVPPRTYTLDVAQTESARLWTRVALDPAKSYDVYASTTGGDPPVPSASVLTELGPAGARGPSLGLGERITRVLGRVVAWLRGQLGRG